MVRCWLQHRPRHNSIDRSTNVRAYVPPTTPTPLGNQLAVRHCLALAFSTTGRKGLRTSHTRIA